MRYMLLLATLVVSSSALAGATKIKMDADLSGAQEVQVVNPGHVGTATASAHFASDLSSVEVVLKVKGGANVVAAHFHCARPGVNGPIAFGLFSPGPLEFDGSQARGTLTNENFNGFDCMPSVGRPVNNIAALAHAMRDGLIYINVHTLDNPGGEVRGQMQEQP